MAKATTEGGSRNKKPSAGQQRTANDIRKAEARKSLTSVKGLASIVGGAILEGVGGPKAKAGKIIGKGVSEIGSIASKAAAERLVRQAARKKISDVDARDIAIKSAWRKAGRVGGRPILTKNTRPLDRATKAEKVAVSERTGDKPGQFKNTEKLTRKRGATPLRVSTDTEKEFRKGTVTVTRTTPRRSSDVRKEAQQVKNERVRSLLTPIKNPSRNKPKVKVPRRARTTDLGKTTASKVQKKILAKKQVKANARANASQIKKTVLANENKKVVKRALEHNAERRRQAALAKAREKNYDDQTLVEITDASGKVTGTMKKGELLKVKDKMKNAAENTENALIKPQRTIDEREPRRRSLSAREVQILRTVGKRDYSKGEVNTLADEKNYEQIQDELKKYFRSPKVRAEDAANEKAAIQKVMADKALAKRAKKIMVKNQKTFRGKPRTKLIKKGKQ